MSRNSQTRATKTDCTDATTNRAPLLPRANMAKKLSESWRPPGLANPNAGGSSLALALRRWLDLQSGSIWRDMKVILGKARGTVVDVGCGNQPYRPLLPSDVDYIGIDIEEADQAFGYAAPDTIFFSGTRWPIDTNSVNLVLATEALEHVPDTNAFLTEARRCLKPGGAVVMTVPFSARYHFIPNDYWRFTPQGIAKVLRDAGFSNIEVYARGNAGTVACAKVQALALSVINRYVVKRNIPLAVISIAVLGPVVVVCAALGNLSLLGQGGDDCLGYTFRAEIA